MAGVLSWSGGAGRDHAGQRAVQRFELVDGHAEPFHDGGRHLQRLLPQRRSLRRQGHAEQTLVVGIPAAGQQAGRLQPLQQRGERSGIQLQQRAERLHRQRRLLPQRQHHQVLRMRQTHGFEHRSVQRDDVAGCHHDGETDLTVEGERILLPPGNPAISRRHDGIHTMRVPMIGAQSKYRDE